MKMRGISPVIATLIILAVTIAAAIALVGWFMSKKGSVSKTETLVILPAESKIIIDTTNNISQLVLKVKNGGDKDVTINYLEVNGEKVDIANNVTSDCKIGDYIVVKVGEKCEIRANLGSANKFVPGTSYSVRIQTETGYSETISLEAVVGTASTS